MLDEKQKGSHLHQGPQKAAFPVGFGPSPLPGGAFTVSPPYTLLYRGAASCDPQRWFL